MTRKIISTDQAPAAIGPYSQANAAGGFLVSIRFSPLDTATMEIVGETAADQARQALTNAKAVVEAGSLLPHTEWAGKVFIRDMGEFAAINEVYLTFFTGEPPARSVVEVSGLPKDVLVEIEMIAYG